MVGEVAVEQSSKPIISELRALGIAYDLRTALGTCKGGHATSAEKFFGDSCHQGIILEATERTHQLASHPTTHIAVRNVLKEDAGGRMHEILS